LRRIRAGQFKRAKTYIGKVTTLQHGSLSFDVRIIEVKSRYGMRAYVVEPLAGKGRMEVLEERLIMAQRDRVSGVEE